MREIEEVYERLNIAAFKHVNAKRLLVNPSRGSCLCASESRLFISDSFLLFIGFMGRPIDLGDWGVIASLDVI